MQKYVLYISKGFFLRILGLVFSRGGGREELLKHQGREYSSHLRGVQLVTELYRVYSSRSAQQYNILYYYGGKKKDLQKLEGRMKAEERERFLSTFYQ